MYRPELAWIGVESNQFGTDEFMKWCEVVGAEPYICLNMGTGTLTDGQLLFNKLAGCGFRLHILFTNLNDHWDSSRLARVL